MRVSSKRSAGLAVIVLAGIGIASAQPAGGTQSAPSAEVTTPRDVELSPEQRLAEAKGYVPTMEQAAATVRRMLEQARAARDVVKVLCLNDKLNQIDVALRTTHERLNELDSAVGRSDADRARHEFIVLQVLRDRVNALIAEANQCIGEEAGFIGDTLVTVTVDPKIPDADPDILGFDPGLIMDNPVLSSPVQ